MTGGFVGGRLVGALVTAAALSFGLVMAGCGGDDGGGQAVIDAMIDEGAPPEAARCVVEELGAEDAERIFVAEDQELSEDDMENMLDALEKCEEFE